MGWVGIYSLSVFFSGKPRRRRSGLFELFGKGIQGLRLGMTVGLLVELGYDVRERHGDDDSGVQ